VFVSQVIKFLWPDSLTLRQPVVKKALEFSRAFLFFVAVPLLCGMRVAVIAAVVANRSAVVVSRWVAARRSTSGPLLPDVLGVAAAMFVAVLGVALFVLERSTS